MRKQLSSVAKLVEPERLHPGCRFEPGPGPYPYFGKPLPDGIAAIDDWNVDGVHLVLHNGVRCRSQKNTLAADIAVGKSFVEDAYLALAFASVEEASFARRVLANTDTTGILLDYFSRDCHIDVEALMAIEFFCPDEPALLSLVTAYSTCEAITEASAAREKLLLSALDSLFEMHWESEKRGHAIGEEAALLQLGEAVLLFAGRDLLFRDRVPGDIAVLSPFGKTGYHDRPLTRAPAIVLGLKGQHLWIEWSEKPCWPVGKTLFIDETSTRTSLGTLYFALRQWVNENQDIRWDNTEAVRAAIRSIPMPACSQSSDSFERAARAALRSIDFHREKTAEIEALQENFIDLKATGLL